MTEERVFGETTIYYIEVKVGGRVLDVVEVWTGCANDPQWLAEMKARFGQLGPGERHAVIKAGRDVAPKVAAQIREELAYAEEGPTKKEVSGYAEAVGATGAGLVRYRDSRMPCKFIRESNCVIGNKYVIGKNEWVLRDRDVAAVESLLLQIDPKVAVKKNPTACMFARSELIERLTAWQKILWGICQANAAPNETSVKGKFQVNSAYRLLGTTCEDDTCGARDSNDPLGHWSGYGIDIGPASSRAAFQPEISSKDFYGTYEAAGLRRPHEGSGEYWHFCPKDEHIRR